VEGERIGQIRRIRQIRRIFFWTLPRQGGGQPAAADKSGKWAVLTKNSSKPAQNERKSAQNAKNGLKLAQNADFLS
jgi:hypothetical protein